MVVELGGVKTPNKATVKAMEYFRQFAKCGNRFWVSRYLAGVSIQHNPA